MKSERNLETTKKTGAKRKVENERKSCRFNFWKA